MYNGILLSHKKDKILLSVNTWMGFESINFVIALLTTHLLAFIVSPSELTPFLHINLL